MATIEEKAGPPQTELARGALTLFDTISSTLANLAPVEEIVSNRVSAPRASSVWGGPAFSSIVAIAAVLAG